MRLSKEREAEIRKLIDEEKDPFVWNAFMDLRSELNGLRAVLQKIADPRLMDHQEPDLYTQLGCIRNLANEALNA